MLIDYNTERVSFIDIEQTEEESIHGIMRMTLPTLGVGFMLHKEFED